jgi:hypothetical protein
LLYTEVPIISEKARVARVYFNWELKFALKKVLETLADIFSINQRSQFSLEGKQVTIFFANIKLRFFWDHGCSLVAENLSSIAQGPKFHVQHCKNKQIKLSLGVKNKNLGNLYLLLNFTASRYLR